MEIGDIFAQIELDLLTNMTKSIQSEDWRSNRFRAFKEYQLRNQDIIRKYPSSKAVKAQLQAAYLASGYETGHDIRAAVRAGRKIVQGGTSFSVDDKKLKALIDEIQGSLYTAKAAALRMTDDMYRQTLVKTQVAMATNLYTLNQSVDMASRDFLFAGINCIKYANGNQVNIVSYAEMALRTANRRAGLQGDGAMRRDWGEHLVYISQYGACSEVCLHWQGRVYVDNVFSGGEAQEGYPMLSTAIENGLFHPNCRHRSSTWYEGLSKLPDRLPEEETLANSQLEARQRYNERQIRKYKRLEMGSVDDANKAKYGAKVSQWQKTNREYVDFYSDILRRDYRRERVYTLPKIKEPEVPKVKMYSRDDIDAMLKSNEDFTYNYHSDLYDELETLYSPWKAKVTSDEEYAIHTYTTSKYDAVNSALRRGGAPASQTLSCIVDCTSALDKASLPEPLVVRRGSTSSFLWRGLGKDKNWLDSSYTELVGQVIEDKGFMSTSPIPGKGFSNDVEYKILLPEKSKAMYIAPISEFKGEQEVLIQKGSMFKIVDVEKVDSFRYTVYMQLIL